MEFDFFPGQPAVLIFDKGGILDNRGTSQMIEVVPGDLIVIVFINGGGFLNTTPSMGAVALGAGAGIAVILEGFPVDGFGDFAQGPASSFIIYAHFGTPGPYPVPGGFFGAVLNNPLSTLGGSGPTAQRPLPAILTIPLGCTYFDTDLGAPIWWNGAAWIGVTPSGQAKVIPEPVGAEKAQAGNTFGAVYNGGLFFAPVPITPAQLRFVVNSSGGAGTDINIALYQAPSGNLTDNPSLKFQASYVTLGAGVETASASTGAVTIERGWYYLLAACNGLAMANFYPAFQMEILNNNADTPPTTFTTAIPHGAPPAALNLGVDLAETFQDFHLIHRFQ